MYIFKCGAAWPDILSCIFIHSQQRTFHWLRIRYKCSVVCASDRNRDDWVRTLNGTDEYSLDIDSPVLQFGSGFFVLAGFSGAECIFHIFIYI